MMRLVMEAVMVIAVVMVLMIMMKMNAKEPPAADDANEKNPDGGA